GDPPALARDGAAHLGQTPAAVPVEPHPLRDRGDARASRAARPVGDGAARAGAARVPRPLARRGGAHRGGGGGAAAPPLGARPGSAGAAGTPEHGPSATRSPAPPPGSIRPAEAPAWFRERATPARPGGGALAGPPAPRGPDPNRASRDRGPRRAGCPPRSRSCTV